MHQKPLRADEAKLLHKFEVSFKDNKGVSKDELLDMIMEAGCAEFIACKWVKALYSKYDRYAYMYVWWHQ